MVVLSTARLVFATTCVVTVAGICYIHVEQQRSRDDLKRGIAIDQERQRVRKQQEELNLARQEHNLRVEQAYREANNTKN